jgi:hypothetical protein
VLNPLIRMQRGDLATAYSIGLVLSWAAIFVTTWIFCIASYGAWIGIGLGWAAAVIAASALCWVWPAIPAVAVIMACWHVLAKAAALLMIVALVFIGIC